MKFGFIGTADHVLLFGPEVLLGNSRGPNTLADVVGKLGQGAYAATGAFADIIAGGAGVEPVDLLTAPKQERKVMKVLRFEPADAVFERSPGQDADIFAANLVDQQQGGPITIGYGRYGPDQILETNIVVDDVMVVLEGRVSVEADGETLTAGPGEIIYMPRGNAVIIRSHAEGARTAYVTYPHWSEAE